MNNREQYQSEIRALLVEDNPVNQRVAVMMLQKLGLHPDLAINGEQALRLIKEKCQEHYPYSIIFLDIFLPDFNGEEICRRVRLDLPVKDQPFIVALTADESPENLKRYLEGGMNAVLHKPLRMNELQEVLDIYHKKFLVFKAHSDEKRVKTTNEVLDMPTLRKWQEMLGGRESLQSVVRIFVKDAQSLFEGIEKGVVEENWKIVHRNAHTLKSTSANLGALRLASILEELELIAYENLTEDFPRPIQELTNKAKECLNRVLEELENFDRS